MNKNSKAILITLGLVLLSCLVKFIPGMLRDNNNRVAWTPQFTDSLYNNTYQGLGGVFTDSDERKIATCIVNKLKIKYPKGIDLVDDNAFEKESELLDEDCLKGMTLHFTWSQKLINKMERKARLSSWAASMNKQEKDKFCTCYINRYKQMYPNGIVDSLRRSESDSAYAYCKQKIAER